MGRLRRLRGRLLVANLLVAGVALGTVLIGVSLVGPGYFEAAMGHPPGDPMGSMMDATTLAAFQDAIRTSLLAATIAALAAALVVSLALSSRIAGPIGRLAAAARRVAQGHYAERVPGGGEDEVADLAGAFNQMAGSLEATERRRLQLVGDAAHELRTPLTTIDGYLEGLQDGVIAASPETWELLRRETGRLSRLVADLQELWRAESHDLPLHLESFDAGELIGDLVERYRPQAATQGIGLATTAEGPLVLVADRDRLSQILGNYLSNALRYTGPQTTVTIDGRRTGGEAVIGVTDAGPGLTPEQRGQVFERFYRIDPSRSRALGGSGIGLAISQALAQAMGGRAWAESDGPGTGSTFYVALPAAG
jgi:signal transduction histidine kinase